MLLLVVLVVLVVVLVVLVMLLVVVVVVLLLLLLLCVLRLNPPPPNPRFSAARDSGPRRQGGHGRGHRRGAALHPHPRRLAQGTHDPPSSPLPRLCDCSLALLWMPEVSLLLTLRRYRFAPRTTMIRPSLNGAGYCSWSWSCSCCCCCC